MPQLGLVELLQLPSRAADVAEAGWNDIVEQGTNAQMLGQLAAALARAGCMHLVPEAVCVHLGLAALTSQRRSEAALWEVSTLRRGVDVDTPLVVLKGCAYAVAGDWNTTGRLFSDIDVLVPHALLGQTEGNLIATGWNPSPVSVYDQHYYRDWMHEVPPMQHVRRHTTVDLHHAINPPVSRIHVRTKYLLEHMVETSPGVYVLAPLDRLIHCALHLVQEGDAHKLLRDLYDLYVLQQQHANNPAAELALKERARWLGVWLQVEAACLAASAVFSIQPVAAKGWRARSLVAACGWQSSGLHVAVATGVLWAYSHWIKMPLRLLVPHLLHKTRLRILSKND